ncbi:uncharacterized protein LOC131166720 [Malania oleifera]|uniref:uncharacterized protein LOC131166720 n=1 Tax=Malania oleifera TaxID=397392 RepID=UPI0025ADDBBB|nr:uncharacterized protein LOC131166720 [Malania oleifera]
MVEEMEVLYKSQVRGLMELPEREIGYKWVIILWFYVSDMPIVGKVLTKVNQSETLLRKEVDIKVLSATKSVLGLEIHKVKVTRRLGLSRGGFRDQVLVRFSMVDVKSVTSTPLANLSKQSTAQYTRMDSDVRVVSKVSYTNVVGYFGRQ